MAPQSEQDPSSSHIIVYVALAGNALVALSKFVAAAMTGSSAMLSEGVHSVVDTTNEVLLLYGIHRGSIRPDSEHPLGYGREVYFWSFVVALMIFTLGAGISIYEGVTHIINPHPVEDPFITYVVLGLSAVFEGSTWLFTLHKFKGKRRVSELFQMVVHSKDPPIFIVLLEDSAALIGIAIAFAGIYLSVRLDQPVFDGIASICIGVVLAITAVVLGRETKGLLIGEAANQQTRDSILKLAAETEGIVKVNGLFTVHDSPRQILVAISIEFEDCLRAPEIETLVIKLEQRIRDAHPSVTSLFVKPQTPDRFRETTEQYRTPTTKS